MNRIIVNFGGGYCGTRKSYREGRQALGLSPRLPKGGQRYRLIGGDSYGC